MSLNINNISVVHWFPDAESHRCGYCKSDSGSISYGMWADTMTVTDYQNLIDRGWRRSGRYCYKPIMKEICCPQYTIRCNALNFKISKSHKKIIKKFNKFLKDGVLNKGIKENNSDINDEEGCEGSAFVFKQRPNININYENLNMKINESETVTEPTTSGNKKDIVQSNENSEVIAESASKKVKTAESSSGDISSVVRKGLGADPNKPPCKKAKLLRIERKQKKIIEKGLLVDDLDKANVNEAKSLKQFLYDIPDNCKHKLKIKMVGMKYGEEIFPDFDDEYEIYKKYQMTVHKDPPEKCSKMGFNRFLVNTPLKAEKWDDDNELGFGSFHQQYWLDNKLIAVGVIDILPKCVSSVYFFYDPDYRNLTLGTYGSLREIDFTRKLHQKVPSIHYYYMGFYIHSCLKMRYKGKLVPSDLLCPETYKWFPITECVPKLEQNKYCRFNDDPKDVDEQACSASDIDRIKIFMFDGYIYFKSYKYRNSEKKVYENIGKLVGKKCLDTLLFVNQRH